jgi:hypothetical protein
MLNAPPVDWIGHILGAVITRETRNASRCGRFCSLSLLLGQALKGGFAASLEFRSVRPPGQARRADARLRRFPSPGRFCIGQKLIWTAVPVQEERFRH